MKKNHLFMLKRTGGLILVSIMFFLVSCSQGHKDDWTFTTDVRDAQLVSPDADGVTVKVVPDVTGGKLLQVEWPVVHGAGGYEFSLYIVDDPDNPVSVGEEKEFVDGCSISRVMQEDTKYKIEVRTLGNQKYNNKEALTATEKAYSTLVPMVAQIPDGSDLATYFEQHPIERNDLTEQVYELVADGNYTISKTIDFEGHQITLRGDKLKHPNITVAAGGGITIMSGFKIRFIDFDCSAVTDIGVVTMSSTPHDSLKVYDTNRYIISKPIVFESSNFKGINQSLFDGNNQAYVIKDFQIIDCIIQINNDAQETPVINLQKNGYNCIKDLMVSRSTVYNLVKNSKTYFIRFGNGSNAQPQKLGFPDKKASVTLVNNTFSQVMTEKDFANNMPSHNGITTTMRDNVFYDCYRINKIIGGSNQKVIAKETNFIHAISKTIDNSDKNYLTEENPNFVGPIDQDPSAVNFTPTNANILDKKSGDPRWLSTQ